MKINKTTLHLIGCSCEFKTRQYEAEPHKSQYWIWNKDRTKRRILTTKRHLDTPIDMTANNILTKHINWNIEIWYFGESQEKMAKKALVYYVTGRLSSMINTALYLMKILAITLAK